MFGPRMNDQLVEIQNLQTTISLSRVHKDLGNARLQVEHVFQNLPKLIVHGPNLSRADVTRDQFVHELRDYKSAEQFELLPNF